MTSTAPVPAGDYLYLYDAIAPTADTIPAYAKMVAGYVSGADHSYWWTAGDWARWPEAAHVRIDTDASAALNSDVLDVENGDATVADAVSWVRTRQSAKGWWSFVYCNASTLPALQAAMKAAGLTKVGYWMADWSLTEAEAAAKLTGDIVAVQYASPSTGAPAGHDVSVSNKTWMPLPGATPPAPPAPPAPPIVPVQRGILVTGTTTLSSKAVTSTDDGKTWQ